MNDCGHLGAIIKSFDLSKKTLAKITSLNLISWFTNFWLNVFCLLSPDHQA